MRTITTHQIKPDDPLRIFALDAAGPGGAPAAYCVLGLQDLARPADEHRLLNDLQRSERDGAYLPLQFQVGDPAKSTNGLTIEALLAVCADRLEHFQRSPFACAENATALTNINAALNTLKARTARRIEQGTEGTHTPEVVATAAAAEGLDLPLLESAAATLRALGYAPTMGGQWEPAAGDAPRRRVNDVLYWDALAKQLGGSLYADGTGMIWHENTEGEFHRIDTEGNPL